MADALSAISNVLQGMLVGLVGLVILMYAIDCIHRGIRLWRAPILPPEPLPERPPLGHRYETPEELKAARCETHGHIFGSAGTCIFCKAPAPPNPSDRFDWSA